MFTAVVKPTHICNLACDYCFNDDVRKPVMDPATLERVVQQTFEYTRQTGKDQAHFIWHGGEPTVVGLDFYRNAVALQEKYADGCKYSNAFQTNGVLVNKEWARFFKSHDFSVSVSLDGKQLHNDRYRVDFAGKGSYHKVERAMNILKDEGIQFGVCLTMHKGNVEDAADIYRFFAEQKQAFHIVPLMKSGGARDGYEDFGLTENEYADAWLAMYDLWFDAAPDYVYVSDFVDRTEAVLRGLPGSCWTASHCCDTNVTVDPEGDVYSCASVSATPIALYGNVNEKSFKEVFASRNALYWRTRQHSDQCTSCKWFHVCHGGCMSRSYKFFGDIDAPDYYCDSLYRIYEHIEKRLRGMDLAPALPHENHMRSQLPADTRSKLDMTGLKSRISSIPVKVVQ